MDIKWRLLSMMPMTLSRMFQVRIRIGIERQEPWVRLYSQARWRIERDAKEKISVKELIKAFPDADVILLEGFKNSGYPKYVCSCPEENADASKIAEVILDMINSK